MPGGVMQLVSIGAQDQFIMGSPEISYFKLAYKRHTNFSMESVRQTFNTKPVIEKFGRNIFTCRINRIGDLMQELYFSYQLPSIYSSDKFRFRWIDNISQYIVENCSIRIDTQLIDQLWGDWMDVWNELSLTADKKEAYDKMTANTDDFNNPRLLDPIQVITFNRISYTYYPVGTTSPSITGRRIFLPLNFWFTKNPGLALPLIALQYQNIEVTVELRAQHELYRVYDTEQGEFISPNEYRLRYPNTSSSTTNSDFDSFGTPNNDVSLERFMVPINQSYNGINTNIDIDGYLECNFIFLDEAERKTMALNSHEFLIQRTYRIEDGGVLSQKTIDLNIQNPIKEIIFVARRSDMIKYNNWNNFTRATSSQANNNILITAKMLWNGMDRFEEKPPEYFNYIQPWQHHSRCPRFGIHAYSFALQPEKIQPSGSFNASTVNKIQLYVTTRQPGGDYSYDFIIYGVYYNVFRIMSGSGGVVFAN